MSLRMLLSYENIGTLHSESVLLVIAKVITSQECIGLMHTNESACAKEQNDLTYSNYKPLS